MNLGRLKNIWDDLSLREQRLLLFATPLLIIILLYIALYLPISTWRADGVREREHSVALYEDMRQGAERLFRQSTPPTTGSDKPIRSQGAAQARALGLALSRIQPSQNGIAFWFDAVPSQKLFQWLTLLKNEDGAIVEKLVIERNDDGQTLRAQIILRGRDQ